MVLQVGEHFWSPGDDVCIFLLNQERFFRTPFEFLKSQGINIGVKISTTKKAALVFTTKVFVELFFVGTSIDKVYS